MTRVLASLVAALALLACTPEEQRLWRMIVDEAKAKGYHCPDAAPLVAINNLPEHFNVVIWRESSCNPSAVSPDGALGLTQIMPFWLRDLCPRLIACTRDDLFDPVKNVAAAAYVYSVQGPEAWSQTW